jgi:hypothetical protein
MSDGRAADEKGVEVAELMREVRQRVRARLATADLDEATGLRLQALGDDAEVDADLLGRLLSGGCGWNVSPDYRILTHRTGLARRLVLLLKGLVRPVVRLYTDQIVDRQAQLNSYLLHLTHGLVRELVRMETEAAALRERCDALERRLAQRSGGSETGA